MTGDVETALDDILHPLRTVTGIFWAFHNRATETTLSTAPVTPLTEDQKTIVDLCLLIEDTILQIEHLFQQARKTEK